MSAEHRPGTDTRGVLYPARLPTFVRAPAPERVHDWVRWFWIPEWDLVPGRVSRQHLLPFPACNLVVMPDVVSLSGPTTRASHRDLTGRGWAVGALLRPAAAYHLCPDGPAALVDTAVDIDASALAADVRAAMATGGSSEARHHAAVAAFSDWMPAALPAPDPSALLANAMVDLLDEYAPGRTVADVARILHVSPRTLNRLAHAWVGLSPSAMLRRRRLQGAVETIRLDPQAHLAEVAASHGYVDHAHLTNQARDDLGITPSAYRRRVDGDR